MNAETDTLRRLVGSGHTIGEIALKLGISFDAARYRIVRAGLKPNSVSNMSVADRAQRMQPGEAVDYLLGVVQLLEEALSATDGRRHDFGFHASRSHQRILECLAARKGATVPKDALFAAVYHDATGDLPDPKIVDVFIHQIRKRIPASAGRIVTDHGYGYRLVMAEDAR